MYCLLYLDCYSKYEPLLTIGPDFKFTLGELIFFNILNHVPIHNISPKSIWFKVTTGVLLLQNITFLLTVLWNPRIMPQNPLRNSITYLNRISNKNLES